MYIIMYQSNHSPLALHVLSTALTHSSMSTQRSTSKRKRRPGSSHAQLTFHELATKPTRSMLRSAVTKQRRDAPAAAQISCGHSVAALKPQHGLGQKLQQNSDKNVIVAMSHLRSAHENSPLSLLNVSMNSAVSSGDAAHNSEWAAYSL